MKLLCTVGFLILVFANLIISGKMNQAIVDRFKSGMPLTASLMIYRFASFLLVFFQFWILTGVFPVYLVLLLMGASTLGLITYKLLGAISGFTLEENQRKIGALNTIWGVNQTRSVACSVLLGSLLVVSAGAILSLVMFWKYPIGDARAIGLIALFHFVMPQLLRIPLLLIISWPTVTSEYLDDDLRNSYLADSFSNIIYQTIFLLFPFWLFKHEFTQVEWSLPPFWVLLSIPLFGFIIGGLLPFFLGLYRYRSQSRSMDSWKARWLKDVAVINTMPAGAARQNAFNEKLEELTNEIKVRFSQNNLFTYYQRLREADGIGLSASEVGSVPVDPDVDAALDAAVAAAGQEALAKRPLTDPVRMARQYLKGRINPKPPADDFNEGLMTIVRENYANLVNWDIRFAYLQDLLQLYEITVEGATKDINNFIQAQLAEIKETLGARSQKKNILAGSFLSVSSTAIIWVFKQYEPHITSFITKLVR